ncbi:proline-rich receptor-like protein kinase PERK1 [Chenopodium quinoa]|uniref:proline-rich receptor-like protein kinase PERK1 n=1 Tax=Chenopodium quinoa TaxID=63459 RepID=UPI000B78A9A5|nr:proline-rich receptor-like protein kinase PERK1 [Chenopodium quinoa]
MSSPTPAIIEAPPTPPPVDPPPPPVDVPDVPPPVPDVPPPVPDVPPPVPDVPPPVPDVPPPVPDVQPPVAPEVPPTPIPSPPLPTPPQTPPPTPPTPAPQPPPPSPSPPPPTPSPSPPPPTPSPSPPPPTPSPSPPPPTPSPSPPPPTPTPTPSPSPPTPSPSPPPPALTPSPSPPPPSPSPPPPPPTSTAPSPITPPTPIFSPPPSSTPETPSLSPPIISQSPPSPSLNPSKPPPSSPAIPPPPSSSTHRQTGLIVGVAIGGVIVLAVFGLLWMLFARRKKRQDSHGGEGYYLPTDGFYQGPAQPGQHSNPQSTEHYSMSKPSSITLAAVPSRSNSSTAQPISTNGSGSFWSPSSGPENSIPPSSQGMVLGNSSSSFSYEELSVATDGFASKNLLGQGGFGYVHKGILPNGKIVAVKSLKADSGQGEREFQAEVETISRVHHKHLVSLVGYCVTGPQKLLVYEFLPNKTMEFHLHGKGQPVMDWPTRLKIAIGSAKGLAYLHEDCHPKIIHRDIKAANILLDFKFEALVADFGLAKFTSDANTHVSTRVMGTFGYLAPEYANSGKLTEKSDVFSFGVLLLELITGRRPVDYSSNSEMEDSLVDWSRPLLSKAVQDGNFDPLVDSRLGNNYDYEEMGSMITCAASCVRHSAKRRPRMSQVVRALEGNLSLSDLNDGVKPGFSSSLDSADMDSGVEDDKKFRKLVYLSEEYGTNEFNRTRSEFSDGGISSSEMQRHSKRHA